MSSNNLFYNIYNKKTSEELKSIIKSENHAIDAKLCSIEILKERNHLDEELIPIEQEITRSRNSLLRSEFAQERYKTGFDRFIAIIIDGIFIGIIGLVFKLFTGIESALIIGLIGIFKVFLPYLYSVLLHGYYGQTFGKMIMNIKIYDKKEDQVISYKQALLRDIIPIGILVLLQIISFFTNPNEWGFMLYLSFVILITLILWSVLEIITMLFNSKRRALHDFIAGTIVLKINSK